MEDRGEVEAHVQEFEKINEVFEDGDGDAFDTLLSFSTFYELKTNLQDFKHQGTNLHGVYQTQFHHFFLDQTLNFLDFVA